MNKWMPWHCRAAQVRDNCFFKKLPLSAPTLPLKSHPQEKCLFASQVKRVASAVSLFPAVNHTSPLRQWRLAGSELPVNLAAAAYTQQMENACAGW
jgi:hypothetical protein